jgi:O-antigen/teichoic acid export membrane protein
VEDHAGIRARADRGAAWVGAASVVLGVLDLLSTLICLWLWVSTAEFGAATLAIALFPILDRLGGMGLSAAVVREANDDSVAHATIFWLGLGVSVAVGVALLLGRPLIGRLFPDPVVASLLAAYGGRLVVMHGSIVPEGLMKRELRYRELSIVRVVASGVDTATKLALAYVGAHGVPALRIWCFALGPIANTVVTTIGIQLCHAWRPRLQFSRAAAVRAARFTSALSGGELLYYVYTSADYLVVGAWFGKAAVGAYRLAYELVIDVVRLLSMITAEVAYPTFVRLAHDARAVGDQLLRFTRQNLIVLAPFLVFAALESDDLLHLLYPPLPAGAATAARILCVVGLARTLGFMLPPVLAGTGRASRVLVYNGLATIILPTAFVLAATLAPSHGFVAVAWAWAAGYPVAFAALLAMALPLAQLSLRAYAGALRRIALCTAGGLATGLLARAACPDIASVRAITVAVAVLAGFVPLLHALEGVTPAAIIRALRTGADQGQERGGEQQRDEQAGDLAEHRGDAERADPEVL